MTKARLDYMHQTLRVAGAGHTGPQIQRALDYQSDVVAALESVRAALANIDHLGHRIRSLDLETASFDIPLPDSAAQRDMLALEALEIRNATRDLVAKLEAYRRDTRWPDSAKGQATDAEGTSEF